MIHLDTSFLVDLLHEARRGRGGPARRRLVELAAAGGPRARERTGRLPRWSGISLTAAGVLLAAIVALALPAAALQPPPAPPPAPTPEWPLACNSYPPTEEAIPHCARRTADGEIVVRPGIVPDEGEGGTVGALVVDGELLFALASGKTAPALPYDNGSDDFVEGLARTVRHGKVGFVDEKLDLLVPRVWDFAFPFEGGFARVCTGCSIERHEGDEHGEVRGGSWGIIDRRGRVVVPVEYDRENLPPPPAREPPEAPPKKSSPPSR